MASTMVKAATAMPPLAVAALAFYLGTPDSSQVEDIQPGVDTRRETNIGYPNYLHG